MIRMTIALLTLVIATGTGAAEPLTFKGLTLGQSTEKEFTQTWPGVSCEAPKDTTSADRFCSRSIELDCYRQHGPALDICKRKFGDTFKYGPAGLQSIFVAFFNNRLTIVRLKFEPRDFDEIVATVRDRFGKPASTESTPMKTRMGAEFTNESARWIGDGVDLTISKYAGTISSGSIVFSSPFGREEFARRKGDTRKDAAKNL